MVPLIDVMLVLLVIFLVTAPLLTHAVKLELPRASAQVNQAKAEKIEFAIDAAGGLFWNGESVTREDAIARFGAPACRPRSPRSTCAPTRRCPTASSPARWPTRRAPAWPRSLHQRTRDPLNPHEPHRPEDDMTTKKKRHSAPLPPCCRSVPSPPASAWRWAPRRHRPPSRTTRTRRSRRSR